MSNEIPISQTGEANLEETKLKSAIEKSNLSLLFEKATTTTTIMKKNSFTSLGEPLSRSFFKFNFNFPTGSTHLMMANAQIKPF